MNSLLIEGTAKTPRISFSAENGMLEISGKSIPENSIEFYNRFITGLMNITSNRIKRLLLKSSLSILIQAHRNAFLIFSGNLKHFRSH